MALAFIMQRHCSAFSDPTFYHTPMNKPFSVTRRLAWFAILVVCGFSLFGASFVVAQPAVVIPVNPTNDFEKVDVQKILAELPTGERWLSHLKDDLLPFWTMPSALGVPLGNFPTYRCNDGSLVDPLHPCPEIKNADPSIVKLNRDYVRAKSRQIFAYGVAYHLTGEEKYLIYAKAGADWLLTHAIDTTGGGAYSWFENGKGEPAVLQRTSQDMAYAVSGIGFLYYLTHDQRYLDAVVYLKQHIFSTYFDRSWGILRWVREKSVDGDSPDQKELVSQLDQIYGYLLWTDMAVEDPRLRKEWADDLEMLASAMREQFWGDTYGLYWGAITTTASRNLGTDHTDFGHSIKTLWLTYRVGMLTGDQGLIEFSKPRMYKIIERAYIPSTGSWALGFKPVSPGSSLMTLNPDKEWWSLAELDQTTATLALVDPVFASVLPRTYDYWFKYMVDHEHGEIWHMVKASDNKPDLTVPKQHSWKNAFHSFEHALIGYLTAQQLHGEPIVLHYAFSHTPDRDSIKPYFYFGEITSMKEEAPFKDPGLSAFHPTEVIFTALR